MGVGWAAVAVPHVECMISVAVRSRPVASCLEPESAACARPQARQE